MSKATEVAIKTFEYGQQVRVKGYQSFGVVTVGNKHCVENGIDIVTVAVGSQEMHCATGDVTATGVQMFYRKCRSDFGWQGQWLEISQKVVVNGQQLFPYGITMYGRNVTVHVPQEMLHWSRDEILEDMATFGK